MQKKKSKRNYCKDFYSLVYIVYKYKHVFFWIHILTKCIIPPRAAEYFWFLLPLIKLEKMTLLEECEINTDGYRWYYTAQSIILNCYGEAFIL